MTVQNVLMRVPATVAAPNTKITLPDGTTASVSSSGYAIIASTFVAAMLNAGLLVANATAALAATQYNTNAATTAATAAAASLCGAMLTTLNMTGTLGAGAALTTDTAANIVAAIPNAQTGQTYRLRVINSGAGAFAWTVTAGTNVTLNGTMTVAQNTWREFDVTLTNATVGSEAVSITSVGTGTNS